MADTPSTPPNLLDGPSARRQLWRCAIAGIATGVGGLFWIAIGRGDQSVLPWMASTLAVLTILVVWRGVLVLSAIKREGRARYTTLGGGLWDDRYWLLDDETGAVIRTPTRAPR